MRKETENMLKSITILFINPLIAKTIFNWQFNINLTYWQCFFVSFVLGVLIYNYVDMTLKSGD